MPGLKVLQDAFRRNVVSGHNDVAQYIASSATLDRDFRLAIYGNAYRLRLAETLAHDYECLQALMGEADFNTLCLEYIDRYPSEHFSLRWFGKYLPAHLGYEAQSGKHGWGAEMAQLEWSFVNSFDALDVAVINEADVAAIPLAAWPTLAMRFHPSVRLVTFWWNTLDRWKAVKESTSSPAALSLENSNACLVWREGLNTQYRSLEMMEAIALHAVLDGADFSELCGVLADGILDQESVPMQAAGFFKAWIASGMIAELIF